MKMKWKPLLLQAFLIVFSVLFALFIDQWAEQRRLAKEKAVALERIERELQQNAEILERMKTRHSRMAERLNEVLQNPDDTLWSKLLAPGYLDLGLLTNQESFLDEMLTSTAWEATKSTEMIAEFDFDQVIMLTKTYKLQEILLENTVAKILDTYFSAQTHEAQNLDRTLLQFKLLLGELAGQERILAYLYKEALQDLNQPES